MNLPDPIRMRFHLCRWVCKHAGCTAVGYSRTPISAWKWHWDHTHTPRQAVDA